MLIPYHADPDARIPTDSGFREQWLWNRRNVVESTAFRGNSSDPDAEAALGERTSADEKDGPGYELKRF